MDCIGKVDIDQLTARHLADLRGSGLSNETIARAGIYSESSAFPIARLLRQSLSRVVQFGPCIVFPYTYLDGTTNGYAVVKPDVLQFDKKGKPKKYIQPEGLASRPYFTPGAIGELRQPLFDQLLITEGQKKSLAADQIGYPAIGLSGPWGWTKKREDKSKPRELIDELAAIDWTDRNVLLVFDTDPQRKFGVNHGVAELARVLTERGAAVQMIYLPVGPLDADGIPGKVGLDDFIVANGPQAFNELVESQQSKPMTVNLSQYRKQLASARVESLGRPGLYFDSSPTGSGKSYADLDAIRQVKNSLTILPTHKNCGECESMYQQLGLSAIAFPEMSAKTCENYEEAKKAMQHGLAASQAVCPTCRFKASCEYQTVLADAGNSDHYIATHHRSSLSFSGLAHGKQYIAIHEDAANILRPQFEISKGLEKVADLADVARKESQQRYGSSMDQATEEYYFHRMADICQQLAAALGDSQETISIDLPARAAAKPIGLETKLFRLMKEHKIWPSGDVLQLVKAIADGQICELVVRVDRIFKKGKQGDCDIRKAIIGIKQTELPTDAPIWVQDATADPDELSILAGRPVIDMTPGGDIERVHQSIQIPIDVKKSTDPTRVVAIARAIILAIPQRYQRIGIICDQKHCPAIKGTGRTARLEACYRDRIAHVEYFRSGASRGSNEWLELCDLLIVLGTPRVPPSAVKSKLIQLGLVKAACRSEKWIGWDRDYWSGITSTGRRVTVQGHGYADRDWHAAYRAMVAAELRQSIGRGRSICQNGIPVVVLTNEELNLQLTDFPFSPISENEQKVLEILSELPKPPSSLGKKSYSASDFPSGQLSPLGKKSYNESSHGTFPLIYILGKKSYRTTEIAPFLRIYKSAGNPRSRARVARRILRSLEKRQFVSRVGKRGGWILRQPPTFPELAARPTAAAAIPAATVTMPSQDGKS